MNSISLKKELFYFDKLIIEKDNLKKSQIIGELLAKACDSSGGLFRRNMQEIEDLEKMGFIEFHEPIEFSSCKDCINSQEKVEFNRFIKQISNFEDKLMASFGSLIQDKNTFLDRFLSTIKLSDQLSDLYSILSSALLNATGSETTPIIGLYKSLNLTKSSKANAVNITINKFPQLNHSLPINELLEFKTDTEIRQKINELRCAITDISKCNYTITEMEEKFEYLLHEYEQQLKLHNKKIIYNNIEISIATTVGLLESLLKLDIINASKNIISLRKEKVNLLLETKNLKGSELAYLARTTEEFKNYRW